MRILSTTDVMATDWGEVFFIIGVVSVVLIGLGILFSCMEKNPRTVIWSVVACIGFAIVLCNMTKELGLSQEYTGEQEYKVILEENADIDALNEKYEIIAKEGEIYTIRERKN